MTLPNPVILVPGITATYLRDQYRLPPEVVWSVITKDYERVALHPDNLRYELTEPARITPDQLFEVAYRELIEELRFNLPPAPDTAIPVFPFGYDWRQPLAMSEAQLEDFIKEVIDRTKLLRHYHAENYHRNPKVNLIGHSMGGLVIAGYLERAGPNASVGKVVTIAAPFRGSLEVVLKVTTGTAELGAGRSGSRERKAARLTPALYHLLPTFEGAIKIEPGGYLPDGLFEMDAWQPSILRTIGQFIQLHGLHPEQHEEQARSLFGALLDEAKSHRKRLEGFSLAGAKLGSNDWLSIVGVDSKTHVMLNIEKTRNGPQFRLDLSPRENLWDNKDLAKRVKTGDGTVPFLGAMSSFISPEKVVCVTPDDFGYWELQDRFLSGVAGFHGIMPNMNMLHRMIVQFFSPDGPPKHNNIWGRPPPNLPPDAAWDPPIPGLPKK